ncbi:MAG: LuxR C-terminal-related transcriptional regulator [Coriobacteriales bacterium]|jgi:DNA-binding CsgD family transcriptional regulator|nr:LuxR C-terminal-related transcriptional regulator [Coriobacteriales bacterium]
MTFTDETPKTTAGWEVSPHIVFGLLGFTLYLAWVFMLNTSPAVSPDNLYHTLTEVYLPFGGMGFRFSYLIAFCLMLLVSGRLSDAVSSKGGVLTLVIGSPLCVVCALLIFNAPLGSPLVFLVAWALLGVAQGALALLWSTFLCLLGERHILIFSALCVGVAAAIVLLMSFLRPSTVVWFAFSLAGLSLLMFVFIHYRLVTSNKPLMVKSKVSDARSTIPRKSSLSVFFYAIGLGFAVCFLSSEAPGLFTIIWASCAVLLASIVIALDTSFFQRITESLLLRLHLPVVLIGIAPLFFPLKTLQILGCTLLVFFFMLMFIFHLSAVSEHVRQDHLNSIRAFGHCWWRHTLGFILGCAACYLPYQAFLPTDEGNRYLLILVLLVLIAVFTFASSLVFEDHYPLARAERKPRPPLTDTVHQPPANDLHTLSTFTITPEDEVQPQQTGFWKRRITQLSQNHNLSPKETDVLFLLAKGRNAEYIQNELVVSRHTAKAHIYHIYKKTGVHSRQELINMLENIELEDD